MKRQLLGGRLLACIRPSGTSPWILSIGGGPIGTAAPAMATSTATSNATLPTFTVNFYEMSDFEKDYMMRCYEYLCVHGASDPSPACSAALQVPTKPLLSSTDPVTKQTTWRPFFDVVMLPDGAVCFGWFRHHPLDNVWIRHTKQYVTDLWLRAPASLWMLHQERLKEFMYAKLHHRQRNLLVFKPAALVKTTEAAEDFQLAIRVIHATSRRMLPFEDDILQLCSSERTTLMDVRHLMEHVTAQEGALSTGSAAALLRMFVSAYARYGSSTDMALMEGLRTAARRVCELARDSGAYVLLTWAAALLGGNAASSITTSSALHPCGETSQMLLAALRSCICPSAAHRVAVLCDQVAEVVSPLCSTLLAEDAYIPDTLGQEFRDLDNAQDIAAAAATQLRPTSSGVLTVAGIKTGVSEGEDSVYFSTVLRRGLDGSAEDQEAPSYEKQQVLSAAPFAWLPGTGGDVRGCWCIAFTHCTLLSAHLRLQQQHFRDNDTVAACVKTMSDAHHMLWVSLIRRCNYTTTPANAWSQYSILTHLASTKVQPSVSVTLLHLTDANADVEVEGAFACSTSLLLGLLFLFPRMELRSFYGGPKLQFCAALSSGTRLFPCYLEASMDPLADPGAHVETMHVPESMSSALSDQLEGRRAAVVCFVQSGLAMRDVFVLEELSSHLRNIIVDS
ncbi:hypothetical protein ABL78_6863 [Leptomonas seymouri]|uniref:Uncharacterized protein n=1 Tax=Leptomonas seymouri TaxID=5684 RepID=A0A0N1I2S1_LEPSE|nr:hypothetical protein ABL78_6863 [Leptomonas seymouri]|eukprot:KPI84085.1 hypothetical protein ABL78_6863 [Leptomonas seymouri]